VESKKKVDLLEIAESWIAEARRQKGRRHWEMLVKGSRITVS
jgi:hypothetical protein